MKLNEKQTTTNKKQEKKKCHKARPFRSCAQKNVRAAMGPQNQKIIIQFHTHVVLLQIAERNSSV